MGAIEDVGSGDTDESPTTTTTQSSKPQFSPPDGQTFEEWLNNHGMSPDLAAEWRLVSLDVKRKLIAKYFLPVSKLDKISNYCFY